jgi:radical SAM protein with 4Fe4S-binding SPASM domain
MNSRKFRKALKRITHLPRNKYLFFYMKNKCNHFFLKSIRSTTVAYPSTIMLELTSHCNLHCTTCPREYAYGKAMDKGNMQVDQAKKIIDEVWPYLDSIGLTGMGETFLYKDIEQVVEYIKSKNKGIIISISTNALLPHFIENVSKLINKIDTIQVSIDGLDDVYETIRRKASFKELDKNLKFLSTMCKNSDTTLMLNMVVTKENYFQMPLLIQYAEKRRIDYVDFSLFNLASVTNIEHSYYDLYKSNEFIRVLTELEHVAAACKGVTITNRNFKTENGFQKCPFPWNRFYICWNGFIAPCCAKPFPKELNFGNVFDHKVIQVLNSREYKGFRKLWFENRTPDFCQKCFYINIEPIE